MEEQNIAQPQAEVNNESIGSTNDTPVADTSTTTQSQQEYSQKFKVKFNHEERELSYDDAVPLIQKGMNYDKVTERLNSLQNDPRLTFVENMAKEFNMTPEQYIKAVHEAKEQERLNNLIEQNIPEEYAREIMENRKFREQYMTERQIKESEARKQAEYNDFFQSFPDAKPENIKPETWAQIDKGMPLKYAYMEQLFKEQQNEINAIKQNQKNASITTGSVTGNGTTSQEFISQDAFNKNKGDRSWVIKNFKLINDSRSKW